MLCLIEVTGLFKNNYIVKRCKMSVDGNMNGFKPAFYVKQGVVAQENKGDCLQSGIEYYAAQLFQCIAKGVSVMACKMAEVDPMVKLGEDLIKSVALEVIECDLDEWCDEKLGENEYHNRLKAKEKILDCFCGNNIDLSLSELNLTALPKSIGALDCLEGLYLHHNKLKCLPVEVYNLNLTSLDVGYNDMCSFSIDLDSFNNLTFIDASYNNISDLPKNLVESKNLVKLKIDMILDGNSLADLSLKDKLNVMRSGISCEYTSVSELKNEMNEVEISEEKSSD
jgi:hypothetical protein